MRKLLLAAFSSLLFLGSCSNDTAQNQTTSQFLPGKWMMHKVYQNGEDLSDIHNPNQSRWVKFANSGQYASGGEPYGLSMGKWEVREDILQMISEGNQDSRWKISIDGNKLTWQGTGNKEMEGFTFILKRDGWKNS